MPDSPELIRSFLADRDFPCPGCSYNLRGVEQPLCPECGRAIELTINRPGRSRGYLLFVLLALGWVFAAGTMNGVRAWSNVRQEASVGPWFSVFQSPRILQPGQSRRIITSPSGSGQTIVLPPTPSSISTSITITGGGVSFSTGGPVATLGQPSLNWSSVSSQSWTFLGWWSGLALLAMLWIIVTLVRRKRFDADRPPRALVAWAWSLFTLYAGYHAIMFTREFIS